MATNKRPNSLLRKAIEQIKSDFLAEDQRALSVFPTDVWTVIFQHVSVDPDYAARTMPLVNTTFRRLFWLGTTSLCLSVKTPSDAHRVANRLRYADNLQVLHLTYPLAPVPSSLRTIVREVGASLSYLPPSLIKLSVQGPLLMPALPSTVRCVSLRSWHEMFSFVDLDTVLMPASTNLEILMLREYPNVDGLTLLEDAIPRMINVQAVCLYFENRLACRRLDLTALERLTVLRLMISSFEEDAQSNLILPKNLDTFMLHRCCIKLSSQMFRNAPKLRRVMFECDWWSMSGASWYRDAWSSVERALVTIGHIPLGTSATTPLPPSAVLLDLSIVIENEQMEEDETLWTQIKMFGRRRMTRVRLYAHTAPKFPRWRRELSMSIDELRRWADQPSGGRVPEGPGRIVGLVRRVRNALPYCGEVEVEFFEGKYDFSLMWNEIRPVHIALEDWPVF